MLESWHLVIALTFAAFIGWVGYNLGWEAREGKIPRPPGPLRGQMVYHVQITRPRRPPVARDFDGLVKFLDGNEERARDIYDRVHLGETVVDGEVTFGPWMLEADLW